MTYPSVIPKNWMDKTASTKKDWYIHYRFHDPAFEKDPKYKYGLLRTVKGMNSEQTLAGRRFVTQSIIDSTIKFLKDGFNPITNKSFSPLSQLNFELSPKTPFITALWKAVDKVKVTPNYLIDMKCVIKGVEKAAIALNIKGHPISNISRRYIKAVLEKCGEQNKRWSPRRHNVYRTVLISLFKELIEMEAVDFNPARDVSKLKETLKIRQVLTKEERILVNDHLHKNYYTFWRFVQIFYASGCRETELINLRVKDVDLHNQTFRATIKKGKSVREVDKAINNNILYLWKELIGNAPKDYFIFSDKLIPGARDKPIRSEQLTRRWRLHVKKKLGITVDLYATKHLRTTSISGKFGTKVASEMNSHTSEAMVRSIYDVNYKNREIDRMKNINDSFSG